MTRRTNHPLTLMTRRAFVRSSAAGLAAMGLVRCESKGADPPVCGALTAPNAEGPFFTPDSPERATLIEPGMAGTPLRVTGRVLDHLCVPVTGALVDFWHADDEGDYDNAGFTLRGHQLTDVDGRYQLDTIVPGLYASQNTLRPRHIHVTVTTPDGTSLTTQLYFEGDPYIEGDTLAVDSLVMALQDGPDGRTDANFDFILDTA